MSEKMFMNNFCPIVKIRTLFGLPRGQGRSQKKNSGGGYGAEGARIEAYKMFHANLFHKKKIFAKISGGFEPVKPPPKYGHARGYPD
jgi:hypothetical protein